MGFYPRSAGSRMVEERRLWAALLLVLFVPASSLLGLARPMAELDGGLFLDIWRANLWGDLAFTLGTVAAGAATGRLVAWAWRDPARRPAALAAVPLSLALHWAVYALAWSFTGPSDGFWSWSFAPEAGVWRFTWDWGWPGLLFCACAAPVAAFALQAARTRAPAVPG